MVHSLTAKSRALLGALTCSLAFCGVHAMAAQAAEKVVYENSATGRCLADSWTTGLVTSACHDTSNPSQRWYESGYGGYWYRLQNASTGRCVDVSPAGVRAWACHPAGSQYAPFQSWRHHAVIGPWSRLQARWGGGCLANYGTRLSAAGCTTSGHTGFKNQVWGAYGW